tara:strand:- start:61 stop:885 length:825 start_codon:yes stop_codon:yes gene_type:complete
VNKFKNMAEIVAIETIEGFDKGCRGVIAAAEIIDGIQSDTYSPSNYMLGVIDRDVREYRGEMPESKCLLILRLYSIESHFVNIEVIDHILKTFTKGTLTMFNQELKESILRDCIRNMELVYLASLEALRGSLDSCYSADFSYKKSFGSLKNKNLSDKIFDKKTDLLDFASNLSVNYDLESLKKICKGKVLLDFFSEELAKSLKKLPDECGVGAVQHCSMCASGIDNSCMYNLVNGFSSKQIPETSKQVYYSEELSYIKERVELLSTNINRQRVA